MIKSTEQFIVLSSIKATAKSDRNLQTIKIFQGNMSLLKVLGDVNIRKHWLSTIVCKNRQVHRLLGKYSAKTDGFPDSWDIYKNWVGYVTNVGSVAKQ
jgi:hypothetical protein